MTIEDLDRVTSMITAVSAVPSEEPARDVADLLVELSRSIPPEASSNWRAIFQNFGEGHLDLRRFDLILGVYLALQRCVPKVWIPVWMEVIEAAGIHPISLVLCTWPQGNAFLTRLSQEFTKLNAKHQWFRRWEDHRYAPTMSEQMWHLETTPGVVVDNVLSSTRVRVRAAKGAELVQIGSGWCVVTLEVRNLFPAFRGDYLIGHDLVTLGTLDLEGCQGVISFASMPRIGGYYCSSSLLFDAGDGPDYHSARCGLRRQGKDYRIWAATTELSEQPLLRPLELPASFDSLVSKSRF